MKSKFISWWIKGSASIIIIFTLMLATDSSTQPFVNVGSVFFSWVLSYLIMITPLGAVLGYICLWFLAFLLDLVLSALGFEKGKVRRYVTRAPSSSNTNQSGNYAGKKIKMLDGMLGSKLGGTIFTIDSQLFVKGEGVSGKRVGNIDSNGIFRANNKEIIGQIDNNGVLREYSITGGKGTGKSLGEIT
jgi:hypothetical protein